MNEWMNKKPNAVRVACARVKLHVHARPKSKSLFIAYPDFFLWFQLSIDLDNYDRSYINATKELELWSNHKAQWPVISTTSRPCNLIFVSPYRRVNVSMYEEQVLFLGKLAEAFLGSRNHMSFRSQNPVLIVSSWGWLCVILRCCCESTYSFRGWPGLLTIYMGKPEILVGKSNGSRHPVWEALEIMGCDLRR